MPEPQNPDLLIIGAGLAGSFLALSLSRAGESPTLIHDNSATASWVPLALYNPASTIRARKGWAAEKCHDALHSCLEELAGEGFPIDDIVSREGVIRPCLDEGMRENFIKSAENEAWPKGWVEWLEPEEMQNRFPRAEYRFGGLWVPYGMTFDTPLLLSAIHKLLEHKYKCRIIRDTVQQIEPNSESAQIICTQNSFDAKRVVVAAGSAVNNLVNLSGIKIHQVKGQTLETRKPAQISFGASVSSRGYIALKGSRMVIGSTYEHHFSDLETTQKAAERLLQKVAGTFPGISTQSLDIETQWAGIRVTTPDRRPLLGKLPGSNSIFLSAGFGSKGMVYAPYCGQLLAENIISGSDLPFEVSLMRQLPPQA